MKKICLLFLIFSLISAIPAFAMKKILNNNDDRRVPSRCSGAFEEYTEEESFGFNTNEQNNQMIPYYNPSYQMERYINYYKPLLSQDMRTELIGTTWYYPKDKTRYDNRAVNPQPASYNNPPKGGEVQKDMPKRFLREAADYYTLDTLGADPNTAYPAGFEM